MGSEVSSAVADESDSTLSWPRPTEGSVGEDELEVNVVVNNVLLSSSVEVDSDVSVATALVVLAVLAEGALDSSTR